MGHAEKYKERLVHGWKAKKEQVRPPLAGLHLGNLRRAPGSMKPKKRKGRGDAAGQGSSCGYGQKGQKSRGKGTVRIGFEGGQTELWKRIPKFQPKGKGRPKTNYTLIRVPALNACSEGMEVDYQTLYDMKAVHKRKWKIFKVVGGWKAKQGLEVSDQPLKVKDLKVRAHAFTKGARKEIESMGGECILLHPITQQVIAEPLTKDRKSLIMHREARAAA